MNKQEAVDQAKFIVSMGQSIHERIIRVQQQSLNKEPYKNGLGKLTYSQIQALCIIKSNEPVNMTQLSELMGVSPPSATSMVGRLVEKGHLVRTYSEDDRRKVNVVVSKSVSAYIRKIEAEILESILEIVEKVGPCTTRKWCEVLKDVNRVLSADT